MTALQRVPARRIVRAIASAAQRWSDADFPPRVRALERICSRTTYSAPVVEYALDRLFLSITQTTLEAVICTELGGLDTLDGFSPRRGRPDAWAIPAGRVGIISSRTTIGVGIPAAMFALCAKCDVVVKDRQDALVAAFAQTLNEELDEMASALNVRAWDGIREQTELASCDVVVAFASNETLATIASALPFSTRLVAYGSRASAGYVVRESLDASTLPAILAGAARDLVLYETQGCLSLHMLFVERDGALTPKEFCEALVRAVQNALVEFPPGRTDAAIAARIAAHRELAAFRAASGQGAVYGDSAGSYVVTLDSPQTEPPAFLPRTLDVIVVNRPQEAAEYVRRHNVPLEAFALSHPRTDAVDMAVDAGALRIARFGELQDPPLSGDHDGRPRIADFIRWVNRTP